MTKKIVALGTIATTTLVGAGIYLVTKNKNKLQMYKKEYADEVGLSDTIESALDSVKKFDIDDIIINIVDNYVRFMDNSKSVYEIKFYIDELVKELDFITDIVKYVNNLSDENLKNMGILILREKLSTATLKSSISKTILTVDELENRWISDTISNILLSSIASFIK